MKLSFPMAGSAGEVAGDSGAKQAHRLVVGAVSAPGEDAIVSAVRANAVSPHRRIEAAVAELVSGPVHPQWSRADPSDEHGVGQLT